MRKLKHSKTKLGGIYCSSLSALFVYSFPLSAQESAPLAIDEVVVTAQMREEKAQNIPLAMSVYNEDFIAKAGANSLSEMEYAIPNINFGRGARSTRGEIAIRGIGDFSRNLGTDARVAVYVDGVLTGRSSSFDQSLLDIDHIEVLRGPQGTLAGTNALAGSINIITQQPSNEFKGSLLVDAGSHDLASLAGKINAPLTPDLYASLSIERESQDGYIYNKTLDRDLQGVNRDAAKLKFRYLGIDKLTLDVGFDYLQDDIKATNAEALSGARFGGYTLAPKPFEVAHDADEFEKRNIKGTNITASYETPKHFKWVSITGIRENSFSELSDEDYSPQDIFTSFFDEKSNQLSQEFRLVSPLGEQLDYVMGVYFLDQDTSTERSGNAGTQFSIPKGIIKTPVKVEVNSSAAYLHGTYHFTQEWSLNAGARYVSESKKIDYSGQATIPPYLNVSHLRDEKTYNELLPKIGLSYQANPTTLLYTSASRGYKSGGWNADFIKTLEDFQFNPEYAINYELGAKSSWWDDRLILNAASFLTKIDDFQVFQFLPSTTNSGTPEIILSLTNAGAVTSKGFELDLNTKLTSEISVSFNAALTQAKFDEFKNGGGIGKDYDNNWLPYAPEKSYFVALDYETAFNNTIEFYAHLDYSYSSDYFSNPDNAAVNAIDARYLANLRLGLDINHEWDLAVWVKNLTNEVTLKQQSISFLGVARGYYNPPRTYGISLKYTL